MRELDLTPALLAAGTRLPSRVVCLGWLVFAALAGAEDQVSPPGKAKAQATVSEERRGEAAALAARWLPSVPTPAAFRVTRYQTIHDPEHRAQLLQMKPDELPPNTVVSRGVPVVQRNGVLDLRGDNLWTATESKPRINLEGEFTWWTQTFVTEERRYLRVDDNDHAMVLHDEPYDAQGYSDKSIGYPALRFLAISHDVASLIKDAVSLEMVGVNLLIIGTKAPSSLVYPGPAFQSIRLTRAELGGPTEIMAESIAGGYLVVLKIRDEVIADPSARGNPASVRTIEYELQIADQQGQVHEDVRLVLQEIRPESRGGIDDWIKERAADWNVVHPKK